jgi:hypothetical protein
MDDAELMCELAEPMPWPRSPGCDSLSDVEGCVIEFGCSIAAEVPFCPCVPACLVAPPVSAPRGSIPLDEGESELLPLALSLSVARSCAARADEGKN